MKQKGGSILIYRIKKYKDTSTKTESIVPEDILEYGNEEDPKLQYLYAFLVIVAKVFNYYNLNSSTAFGNPDLEFFRGQIRGFMMAKQWEWDEVTKDNEVVVYIKLSSGRTIMTIEKPNIPESELNRRQEIKKELDMLGI